MPTPTQERFRRCLSLVLAEEGGFVNHPRDPGGATNKGVTQKVYDAYRDAKGEPHRSVRHIEAAELEGIYLEGYWRPAGCDGLAPGLDLMVFDTAVNMGVRRASIFLQTAANVKQDGKVGPQTLAATRTAQPRVLVDLIATQRRAFYRGSDNFDVFGRGWMARVDRVAAKAHEWAA